MTSTFLTFIYYTNITIVWYFLFINFCYILLLFTSVPDIFAQFRQITLGNIPFFIQSKAMPPITAVMSAFNEREDILSTVQSLLKSDYPNLNILIINDGSDDDTMQVLHDNLDLVRVFPIISQKIKTVAAVKNYYLSSKYPNITIIDKEHSGKSDSLNIGVNACTTPLFITIDADTILEKDAITLLAFSMLSQPHTIAEGGSIYILNGCSYKEGEILERKMSTAPLVAMQCCEYLRAFLFGRTGWKPFKGPLILSGALTLFERQAVIEVGGYSKDSPGEDMEIIVSMHEYMRKNKFPYRIGYSFSSIAWTHVPSDMNSLWGQRDRWHRGLIDSLFRHKKMFFNPKYGATGLMSYPFQFIGEFLGPLFEFTGYIAVLLAMYFNVIDWRFALLFFVATWGFTTIITLATMLISIVSFNKYKNIRDVLYLFLLVIFESCGYRQVLALCRFVATFRYFVQKLIPH